MPVVRDLVFTASEHVHWYDSIKTLCVYLCASSSSDTGTVFSVIPLLECLLKSQLQMHLNKSVFAEFVIIFEMGERA